MSGRLQNKVAVITGGGSGIGEATAKLFAEEGAKIVVADWSAKEGRRVADEIVRDGGRAAFVRVDVSKEADARRMAAFALKNFDTLDVLVCDAGVRVFGPLSRTTERAWDYILGINLKGVAFSCRACASAMADTGGGSIVTVSSANAVSGRGGMGAYDATKAGVLALTRTLAVELAPQKIRVNAICPGPTITQFHLRRASARGWSEAQFRKKAVAHNILRRWAEAREIAYGILFLACEESSFVTGTSLMVDGGLSVI